MYKIFISHFGLFNENVYEGFIEFIAMAWPAYTVQRLIEHLKYADESKSYLFLRRCSYQHGIDISTSPIKCVKVYKENSCFRYIFELILSRVGNPQDFAQKEIQRVVKVIKDYCEDN